MNKHVDEHRIVEESLSQALFELMDRKPFSEISVTELVNRAGVARATYYRNYSCKEEIITRLINLVLSDFRRAHPVHSIDDRMTNRHFAHVLEYVEMYRTLMKILNKSGMAFLYLDCINKYIMDVHRKDIHSDEDVIKLYAFAGAEFNIIFSDYIRHLKADPRRLVKEVERIFERADAKNTSP